MSKKIGFIGLGIMGKPMALNLLAKGYEVIVNDLNKEAVQTLIDAGATAGDSAKIIGENSDVIITMLPASHHVQQVVLGDNGVLSGAKKGAVIIDMSSITPVVSKEIAAIAEKQGVEMLDAPVSGGEPKAKDGTLAIMVGGKEEVFEQVKDVLYAMGAEVTLVGGNGSGTTAKLANQVIVNLNIAAMSEALVLAAKAGIDVEKMYQAIRGGLAGSAVLDAKAPLILDRNFVAGGRIDINMKDITNVMDTAHSLGVPMPLSSQLLEIFHALKVDGKAADDHGGIVQYFEKLANVEVGRV
ncbi:MULTISPECIES: 2-hydroxy-3-oxopropionate reductase [Psychrobacillus]|uniref:2-hydroxy-3-oxopropionate reductase n=1 Tax=Psychrobacillus lasiicapitis TaxID=1636719 RepID=A0A544SVE4_9BACI|nr:MULTISPECIES: 2-hydroxy-3-oxopropionate reductase [Psychrobacillus]MDI2586686.1 2-hydroxy-3-oxopropionate reductase [Psychrobacillus sp. NEAU-3TGS]TQR09190.1 2-hydroxy-3-oxopropionate reductase [Psychrobacillus lasiicapitis]GGA48249.1 2-hydroxy-3-oxopropionate reductase [Psychrobacillus lasiicapitis]